jgi:hypothetical protein
VRAQNAERFVLVFLVILQYREQSAFPEFSPDLKGEREWNYFWGISHIPEVCPLGEARVLLNQIESIDYIIENSLAQYLLGQQKHLSLYQGRFVR